ncbi:hypothetical protein BU23DRAFT_139346 [Bimuria novae-zelandiae CBS 107.79]|uniref:Uncharacterized protein n=1 Tax=Bimuria novae-zelandiae CBS 107.79 TaxID=1447943 RepID=A0A6A5V7P7_9PLEO|nr:hypothetical protein BU23DRAFT_139346 [Bimuria novae-zelandiae CBS 107.79]
MLESTPFKNIEDRKDYLKRLLTPCCPQARPYSSCSSAFPRRIRHPLPLAAFQAPSTAAWATTGRRPAPGCTIGGDKQKNPDRVQRLLLEKMVGSVLEHVGSIGPDNGTICATYGTTDFEKQGPEYGFPVLDIVEWPGLSNLLGKGRRSMRCWWDRS